jgi:uracil-DNA glycosylase
MAVEACSYLLEKELKLFPNTIAILAMGDVAIKAVNHVSRRQTGKRAIRAGSTYKIRRETYCFGETRVFPSYLPTGRSYLIEKSKQRMIAEDIRTAPATVG